MSMREHQVIDSVNVPVLVPKPLSVEYGTSTTSRRCAASVERPEPQTMPTRGFKRCSLPAAVSKDAMVSSVAANGKLGFSGALTSVGLGAATSMVREKYSMILGRPGFS
jgi:hypothetical protein